MLLKAKAVFDVSVDYDGEPMVAEIVAGLSTENPHHDGRCVGR